MTETNVASAVAHYQAMAAKDLPAMARHSHPDARLVTPMEQLAGKAAVLEASQRLLAFIQSIEVHARLGSEHQAMLTYDMNFAEPIGVCCAAALVTFQDGLIVRNELFFDASPFKRD